MRYDLPVDRICKLYRSGKSIPEIADMFGVSNSPIRDRLIENGVERHEGRDGYDLPRGEIIEAYQSGESVLSISDRMGISRTPINRILREEGVEKRSAKESTELRMNRLSAEERSALTDAANEAMREKDSDWHEAQARKQALTKQKSLEKLGKGEWKAAAHFARNDVTPVMQKAIGPYNADIAIGSVAVEVHNMAAHPHTQRTYRLVDILNAGWHLFYIKINYTPFERRALDKALAFFNFARRHPSIRREYRVIRGDGEFIAAGYVDSDDLALIPRSESRFNL